MNSAIALRLQSIAGLFVILFVWPFSLYSQSGRHVKVLLESQQLTNSSGEALQGSGSVVIRRGGSVQPSGRLGAGERQTTVRRSSGIFTLVRDGGDSILTVATQVPYRQFVFYRDWATGLGYLARDVVFRDVGTSLRVSAKILPENHVHVRLTPRISYFSNQRAGIIDFTEAQTELILANGEPMSLGGSTTNMHQITRRLLGFADRSSGSETNLVVTATIQ